MAEANFEVVGRKGPCRRLHPREPGWDDAEAAFTATSVPDAIRPGRRVLAGTAGRRSTGTVRV
ncbi:hypothetical protein NVS89_02605 [Ancylobacter sp. MQZ15Z-1]|uniref:Uncharacterized protein n=1 Tax=Ancylobacter mangrovi TaxID=2972472 RepID=A0A9X2T0T2_9HYPH|nr:hypothetical protein [Ancylobacter mangrovi]MCS0493972.1 hypothetical protein [Ancylobacter mangrovi]